MTAVLSQNYVVAPTVEALKGTLLDAASVSEGIAWLEGDDLFESYNCMKFEGSADFCTPTAKTFDQSSTWNDGFKFAAYGGVVCRAVGLDMNGMVREVKKVFKAGESTAVERALMDTRFQALATKWAAPTDVTPASGAVSPSAGLGLLEGYAGSVYVGAPTIHVPRSIASQLLAAQAATLNGEFRSKMGSKIAAGVGYDFPNLGPTGAAAAAGEKWLYATGEVVVRRGPAEVRQAMAHNDNEVYVLGERGYVVAVDCFAAAVRVTLT